MLGKIGGLLAGANKKMADLNGAFAEKVSQAKAIQDATYPVHRDAYSEKLHVETALRMAKLQVEQDELMKDPLYREGYEKLSHAIREASVADSEGKKLAARPLPVFKRKIQHPDPKTEQAIMAKLDQMKEERAYFLQGVVRELTGNALLTQHFEEKLKKLGGAQYMASLTEAGLINGKP